MHAHHVCWADATMFLVADHVQRLYYFGLKDGLIDSCFSDPDFVAAVGQGRKDAPVGSMFRWVQVWADMCFMLASCFSA
jgi:hypothetical protein